MNMELEQSEEIPDLGKNDAALILRGDPKGIAVIVPKVKDREAPVTDLTLLAIALGWACSTDDARIHAIVEDFVALTKKSN